MNFFITPEDNLKKDTSIMSSLPIKHKFHFGIDVGKDHLDVYCLQSRKHWQIDNTPLAISKFARLHRQQLMAAFIVIDMAGGFELAACDHFHACGFQIHRSMPQRVKSFIAACGQLAKTDAIDARMLALYGKERQENLQRYQPRDKQTIQLKALVERRQDLVRMQTAEKNRLQAPARDAIIASTAKVLIATLQRQIKKLEQRIDRLIETSPAARMKATVLKSMTGIGEQTARVLIALMPELGTMNASQAASLAGLAPRANESGRTIRPRRLKGGRPRIRQAMFIAALSAANYDKKHQIHYRKLLKNGKKPIVAITAIARKLIVIANAKIRDEMIVRELS